MKIVFIIGLFNSPGSKRTKPSSANEDCPCCACHMFALERIFVVDLFFIHANIWCSRVHLDVIPVAVYRWMLNFQAKKNAPDEHTCVLIMLSVPFFAILYACVILIIIPTIFFDLFRIQGGDKK